MASCSIVIVSYYTGPSLFATVKSAIRQKQLAEVILVNNENPPDIVARLQQMALAEPRLKIITGQGNIGFAKSCNLGAKKASGEFLLLLNPNCLLPPDALTECMAAFDEVTGAMLASGLLQNPDGSERRGGRLATLTPARIFYQALGLTKFMPLPLAPDIQEVPAVSSDFMCIRTNDYHCLFGMDEGYFLQVEDADFCMRVRSSGGKIIFIPRIKITYMQNPEGKTSSRSVQWSRAKGTLRYLNTHFRGKTLLALLWLAEISVLIRSSIGIVATYLRKKPKLPKMQSLASKRLMTLAMGFAELPETHEFLGTHVLVTGATSHIGLCVLRRLLASGATVVAMSRGEAIPFRHERLNWLKGNLMEKPWTLNKKFASVAIHCAPLWHLPHALHMLEDAGVTRLIAFGSTSIFSKASSQNSYDKSVADELSKAEANIKKICEEKNIRWTVFRPTLVYGGGLDRNLAILAGLIKRFGIFAVYPPALGKRQPVHADDLAIAALSAIGKPASHDKSYNIGGGEVMAYRDMIGRIFTAYRKKIRIVATTMLPFLLDLAGRLLHKTYLNGEIALRMNDDQIFFQDDAAADLGYAPRSFLSGGIKDIEGY